jgi:DeoR/GlpR family transcriptional regulator of sugar metabolism
MPPQGWGSRQVRFIHPMPSEVKQQTHRFERLACSKMLETRLGLCFSGVMSGLEEMLAQERRDAILHELVGAGQAKVRLLALELHVSESTIRRDLRLLARQGLIEKVRGGAILPRRLAREPHFVATRRINSGAKTAIARAAMQFVKDDTTIALSAGTTTWLVAKHLRDFRDLRFVTNSMNIAVALEEAGWTSIFVSGGEFRTPSDALVGPFAEQTLRQLRTDQLFIGAHSVDPAAGLTTPNVAEAEANRIMIQNARQVVAVVDGSKLGHAALASFAALDDIDVLVTDGGGDPDILEHIRTVVPNVVVAAAPRELTSEPA